jgi:YafQ family addiction module toxin component
MMYDLEFKESVEKLFHKLAKKNPKEMDIIDKKIAQIREYPYHFKPLKKPMANKRRVHVVGSMVLVYVIAEATKTVIIFDYDDHDNIYKK